MSSRLDDFTGTIILKATKELTTGVAVCLFFLFIIIIIIRNKKHELSLRRLYRYHNFKSDKGTDLAAVCLLSP